MKITLPFIILGFALACESYKYYDFAHDNKDHGHNHLFDTEDDLSWEPDYIEQNSWEIDLDNYHGYDNSNEGYSTNCFGSYEEELPFETNKINEFDDYYELLPIENEELHSIIADIQLQALRNPYNINFDKLIDLWKTDKHQNNYRDFYPNRHNLEREYLNDIHPEFDHKNYYDEFQYYDELPYPPVLANTPVYWPQEVLQVPQEILQYQPQINWNDFQREPYIPKAQHPSYTRPIENDPFTRFYAFDKSASTPQSAPHSGFQLPNEERLLSTTSEDTPLSIPNTTPQIDLDSQSNQIRHPGLLSTLISVPENNKIQENHMKHMKSIQTE